MAKKCNNSSCKNSVDHAITKEHISTLNTTLRELKDDFKILVNKIDDHNEAHEKDLLDFRDDMDEKFKEISGSYASKWVEWVVKGGIGIMLTWQMLKILDLIPNAYAFLIASI